ncbi:hypothetical protein CMQ_7603 [Grosmannia clavigera kw1407]|uniref:Alternative oxidase n=1 Tax=Grosmannia clavigera (strain kw1407 / UAMH 11150) TaxID=655863 RepID=F0XPI7_GROCL|nr:uncharacterized protein CMQ_7603 [Grosmannia clavigera kw1407]EFX00601.1 hypothetical protein CMQ_7603 [Grosmannia clavigera kw1407]
MINRRFALVALLLLLFVWSIKLLPLQDYSNSAWRTAKQSLSTSGGFAGSRSGHAPSADFFEQVFSVGSPAPYEYAALSEACAAADWEADEAYLNCVGILAGMTSIVSQVKVCLKMAVETGSHLVLPRMPLRSSSDLLDFNFFNEDAYMPYDRWFDADHLRAQLARACPRMRVVHPDELDSPAVPVARRLQVLCSDAVGYNKLHSYFWVGRPFRSFFVEQYRQKVAAMALNEVPQNTTGITVVDIDSEFMVFRITDDPTGRDLRLWTDLSHLVRYRQDVRDIVDRLVSRLPPPGAYYGVHYRAENDSIWSSAEHQLAVDLDALDRAWARFGNGDNASRPLVYLACGDALQVERFVAAAAERGWPVTHKWRLARQDGDETTASLIDALAFDFQGAIDMGVMVRSGFFIGIQGSAFSSTLANQRDITGRYRGSSLDVPDDGARSHLFNDLDANEYACCL